MYHDFKNSSRSGWRYIYTGEELHEAAKKKLGEFTAQEHGARELMATYLQDHSKSISDPAVVKVQADITRFGELSEECRVYVHEFARTPKREFSLSLGDVVFFGLV